MLRIPVGKDWVITSDAHQFILNKRSWLKPVARRARSGSTRSVITRRSRSWFPGWCITTSVTQPSPVSQVWAAEIGRIGELCQEAFSTISKEDK